MMLVRREVRYRINFFWKKTEYVCDASNIPHPMRGEKGKSQAIIKSNRRCKAIEISI